MIGHPSAVPLRELQEDVNSTRTNTNRRNTINTLLRQILILSMQLSLSTTSVLITLSLHHVKNWSSLKFSNVRTIANAHRKGFKEDGKRYFTLFSRLHRQSLCKDLINEVVVDPLTTL